MITIVRTGSSKSAMPDMQEMFQVRNLKEVRVN